MIALLATIRHTAGAEETLRSQGVSLGTAHICITARQRCGAVEIPRPRPPSVKACQTEANAQLGGQNSYTANA